MARRVYATICESKRSRDLLAEGKVARVSVIEGHTFSSGWPMSQISVKHSRHRDAESKVLYRINVWPKEPRNV